MADKLAQTFGLHLYDIGRKKLRSPLLDRDGNFQVLRSRTDKERLRIFGSVLREFPLLSKMYADVIVSDTFHRSVPREYFLSEARKYFNPVVFIWIESDESSVPHRLKRMQQSGRIKSASEALRIREQSATVLQAPPPAIPRFLCTHPQKSQSAELWELIKQQA